MNDRLSRLDPAGDLVIDAALRANGAEPFDERAWLATVGYEDEQRDPDDRDWLDRVYAAMMATKSLRVCKALLRGESVHRSQLDPSAVRAIERRSRRS